jgi:sigma-B regulation protein RsbU (phosphoserine phosphatase)
MGLGLDGKEFPKVVSSNPTCCRLGRPLYLVLFRGDELEDCVASLPARERATLQNTQWIAGSATARSIQAWLMRLMSTQFLYLAIAVIIYGIFWAIRPEATNLLITVVYTLCLCNLTTFALAPLGFLHVEREPIYYWVVFLALLIAVTPVMVTITTGIVFWVVDRPGGAFWNYLLTSWKFPSVATVTFGIAFQIYTVTKCRLERRNRELEQTVESNMAERELQEEELNRAREIQQALLPKEIPQIEGFEVAGTWEPARIVGGDYFDVIKLSEQKLGICIADVVGKGVPAALFMANVQATVRAYASESASPAWLCQRVNSVVCANITAEKFVTLFYGILDARQKTMEYVSAGHPRPILKNASGEVTQLDNGGAALGVFPNWRYEDSFVQLAPGDRLVLFTDGITEAARPDGEQFGEEGLIRLIKTMADEPPSKLNKNLLTDVKSFCDSRLEDDATLISIAVCPTHSESNPKDNSLSLLAFGPEGKA